MGHWNTKSNSKSNENENVGRSNIKMLQLKVGVNAELVLFDPNESWIFEKKNVFSRSINSPFYGQELSGKIKYTVSKGYISQIS